MRVIDAASDIAGYRRVVDNRTKRGIALDLRQPEGRAVLRVIDAASDIAGPGATTILVDLGAEAIKVEPPDGDPYRRRLSGPGVPESPYDYRWIVAPAASPARSSNARSRIVRAQHAPRRKCAFGGVLQWSH